MPRTPKFEPVAWAAGASFLVKAGTAYATYRGYITADQAAAVIAGESTVFAAVWGVVRQFVQPTAKVAAPTPAVLLPQLQAAPIAVAAPPPDPVASSVVPPVLLTPRAETPTPGA